MPAASIVRALWWLMTAALAAVALRLWHAVLMKEAIERPLVIAGWIGLAWLIILASHACERRGADLSAPDVPAFWSRRSPAFWSLLVVFSGLLLLFHVGFLRAASDGRGYFAQLNSIVIDRDLDFRNNIESFGARAADAAYPLGTAVMWTPFFLLAHAWIGLCNFFGAAYPADGYWNPYQRAIGLGTLAYGFGAFLMIGHVLRRQFDNLTSQVAIAGVLLATPAVWYLTVDASMSHGASLFAATAFLAACITTRDGRTLWQWVLVALLAALMIFVRPQNLLFLAVLGVEALIAVAREVRARGDRRRMLRAILPYALPAGIVLAIGLYLLLAPASGGGTPYVLRMGLLQRFRLIEQLFSPHHGLVSSSPIIAVALLGLPLLVAKERGLALGLMAAVGAQLLVNGTSSNWNAGASFGARRFVECALPFAFGLAAAVDAARRRPAVPLAIALAAFVGLNLALVDDTRRGRLTLSEPVPFIRMVEAVTSRIGNPAALPGAMLFAWYHDLPVAQFDRMGRNVTWLRVEPGNPDHEGFLVSGWLDAERDSRHTFRWATGPEAIVAARVRQSSYLLRFHAEPFTWQDAPPQIVEVRVGQTLVTAIQLTRGYRTYEVPVPETLTPTASIARLSFRFSYARSPRDIGMSEDPRRLAARFALIELVPAAGMTP